MALDHPEIAEIDRHPLMVRRPAIAGTPRHPSPSASEPERVG